MLICKLYPRSVCCHGLRSPHFSNLLNDNLQPKALHIAIICLNQLSPKTVYFRKATKILEGNAGPTEDCIENIRFNFVVGESGETLHKTVVPGMVFHCMVDAADVSPEIALSGDPRPQKFCQCIKVVNEYVGKNLQKYLSHPEKAELWKKNEIDDQELAGQIYS